MSKTLLPAAVATLTLAAAAALGTARVSAGTAEAPGEAVVQAAVAKDPIWGAAPTGADAPMDPIWG